MTRSTRLDENASLRRQSILIALLCTVVDGAIFFVLNVSGQPLVPVASNFYYKLGYFDVKAGTVQPFPKGLRMIAGNAAGTRPVAWCATGWRSLVLVGAPGRWRGCR